MFANRMLVVLIGCLSLAACVAHDPHLTGAIEQPSASVIPQARMVAAAPSARAAVEVLAITTRRDSGAFNLTRERDYQVQYGVARVSVLERRDRRTGPATIQGVAFDAAFPIPNATEFASAVGARTGGFFQKKDVLVFVHGYNNTFKDAVERTARLVLDTGFDGVPVAFAWPSGGRAIDYLYDLQSATFSRDELSDAVTSLARAGGVGKVHLVAHSMGSWLTMEALRQLALTQQSGVLASIASVTLIAPDVDVDVFQKQIAQLPALKSKVLVVASSYDFALGFSKRLSAGVLRLGQRAAAYLQDIGIRFVDATSRRTDPIWGHYRATDPTVISHIKDMLGLVPQQAIAQARE